MARRTATSYRSTRTTVTKTDDQPAEAVVVVEKQGPSFPEALIVATTILLLAAIVLTDMYLGKRYGAGFLF